MQSPEEGQNKLSYPHYNCIEKLGRQLQKPNCSVSLTPTKEFAFVLYL
ncbi:hypothetical protein IFM89_033944 [Coptis chinensis]|uniref:Uncharacterized protein n=1 Tax=Coptis chinensis TaxID=261450 RepID=A0A835HZ06_9MAGN|nr:hypothetical protein IFM89_033944 [Coptis chinensis]